MNTKPEKQTLRQQLTADFKLPVWVALSFFIYGASAGYAGGMMIPEDEKNTQDLVTAATFAVVGLLAPVVASLIKKAKRKAVDEAAVSPVIGVILMVAITVVLAAVVFIFVSKMANADEAAPELAFSKDDNGAAFTVLRADADLDWADFTVSGCTTVPTGTLDAGDQMTGCAGRVTVMHEATNTLVFQGEGA